MIIHSSFMWYPAIQLQNLDMFTTEMWYNSYYAKYLTKPCIYRCTTSMNHCHNVNDLYSTGHTTSLKATYATRAWWAKVTLGWDDEAGFTWHSCKFPIPDIYKVHLFYRSDYLYFYMVLKPHNYHQGHIIPATIYSFL